MSSVFISYSRHSDAIVRTLVSDIESLGHTVWFDQELGGGQTWWDQILAKIRDCDVFAFVLDPKALNSTACKREYSYAADLVKPILPVLAAEGISTNLLPPALSQIQILDYRKQDRDAVLRLARAFFTIPSPKPLPDPMPIPPEIPISYLGRLAEQIETTSTLDYEKQSALVVDLKRSLREPETTDDAYTLLERLRKRRDLFATIAEEINELLGSMKKASSVPHRAAEAVLAPQEPFLEKPRRQKPAGKTEPLETEKKPPGTETTQRPATQPGPINAWRTTTPEERVKGATIGAILGTIIGAIMTFLWIGTPIGSWALITGAGGAIAGAIAGTHRQVIVGALIGAVLGFFSIGLFFSYGYLYFIPFVFYGGIYGAPTGAILGAVAVRFVYYQKQRNLLS